MSGRRIRAGHRLVKGTTALPRFGLATLLATRNILDARRRKHRYIAFGIAISHRSRMAKLRLADSMFLFGENPVPAGPFESGRRDLNSGPLVPQTSALTRLRHAPRRSPG